MEPQQKKVESVIAPLKKVTPVSKYLALALFIILPFLGGYVGYEYAPEKIITNEVVSDSSNWSLPEIRIDLEDAETKNDIVDENDQSKDIPSAYDSSLYRSIAVLHNPYYPDESKYDSVVVTSPRGINDYSCGGKYVPSECYIFLESSYSEIETPKFVGVWTGGAIKSESLKFVSPSEISIGVANGDGCFGYKATFIYDLNTGSSTQESYEDLSSPDC